MVLLLVDGPLFLYDNEQMRHGCWAGGRFSGSDAILFLYMMYMEDSIGYIYM